MRESVALSVHSEDILRPYEPLSKFLKGDCIGDRIGSSLKGYQT